MIKQIWLESKQKNRKRKKYNSFECEINPKNIQLLISIWKLTNTIVQKVDSFIIIYFLFI